MLEADLHNLHEQSVFYFIFWLQDFELRKIYIQVVSMIILQPKL